MKPFNREEAKAGKPLVTRDGRKVMHYHDTELDIEFPIWAIIEGEKSPHMFSKDGLLFHNSSVRYDLFMAPEKREYWVSMFWDDRPAHIIACTISYSSFEEAKESRDTKYRHIVYWIGDPIKIYEKEV